MYPKRQGRGGGGLKEDKYALKYALYNVIA